MKGCEGETGCGRAAARAARKRRERVERCMAGKFGERWGCSGGEERRRGIYVTARTQHVLG